MKKYMLCEHAEFKITTEYIRRNKLEMHLESPVGRLGLDVENCQSSYENWCHARG